MSQNRGTFASQWTVPPPTTAARSLTEPVTPGSPAALRKTRGSVSGSGSSKYRFAFSSSLENGVEGRGLSSPVTYQGPRSRMTTSQPASASSSATTLAPAPLPTMTARSATSPPRSSCTGHHRQRGDELVHRRPVGGGDRVPAVVGLDRGRCVADGLPVTGPLDLSPCT